MVTKESISFVASVKEITKTFEQKYVTDMVETFDVKEILEGMIKEEDAPEGAKEFISKHIEDEEFQHLMKSMFVSGGASALVNFRNILDAFLKDSITATLSEKLLTKDKS